MTDSPSDVAETGALGADEAFALLGNDTRVGILRALWDAFESGTGDNAVPFSTLYERVDIGDTGNFSYHLEKLSGPFVRSTEDGYELKQTGINVLRAIVAGTVTADPAFGPTQIDVPCPFCDTAVEVTYADELLSVRCPACEGIRRWKGQPGFLYGGLVPPAGIAGQPIEAAFHRAITYGSFQIAGLHRGACPHCASPPEITLDVCADHDPGDDQLCPNCGWNHVAEAWLVCSTCKRSAFPPVRLVALSDPRVTAFYGDHDVDHRFSWEMIQRSIQVEEELVSEDPFELTLTIPAGSDALRLTIDEELSVVPATT